VFRSLEIKLELKVVLPLLEMIRAQAAAIEGRGESAGQPGTEADATHHREAREELRTLLGIFGPDFPRTATIAVSAEQTPAVLRACAYLRLGLRHGKLAGVSDAAMEDVVDPGNYGGELQQAALCYLFLSTLQSVLLQKEATFNPAGAPSRWRRWLRQVQNYFSPLRADHVDPPQWTRDVEVPPADQSWQVVVFNDPVNLMFYVTTVFQLVLGLPPEVAHQRMREVHERKQSLVFRGPREKAETHARALRAWHLKAQAVAAPRINSQ
jgi:ATP-dependent Clp protease adaptor protein ClpS